MKMFLFICKRYAWVLAALLASAAVSPQAGLLGLPGWTLAGSLLVILAASSLAMQGYVRRVLPAAWERFCLQEAAAMLLLCLPWFLFRAGLPLNAWGQNVSLSVVGSLRFPWMKTHPVLPAPEYFQLVILGAGWVLAGFFRLVFWLRALWRCQQQPTCQTGGSVLFLTALAAGFWLQGWAAAVFPPTGDEVHYLLMARSFLADGDFDLKNNFAREDWKQDYPGTELDFHGHPDAAGRWISRHMPGISVLMAPGLASLGSWGAAATMLIVMALALWMLYGLARDLGAAPSRAFLAYAVSLVCAPWSVWGYLAYPVGMGMLLLLSGLRLFVRLPKPGAALGLGGLSSLLPFFHQGFGILGLTLLAAACWRLWRDKYYPALLYLALPALVVGLPFVYVLLNYYQTAHQAGDYAFSFRPIFFTYAVIGEWVDRNYGVLTAAPVLLLALAGLKVLRQTNQLVLWLLAMLVAVSALQASLFVDWNGFSASFSRFLAPACAPLYAGLAFILPVVGRAKLGAWFFIGMSAAVSLSTWIMPALLYEMPKARFLPMLAAHHVPAIWKLFPLLKGEAQWGAVAWGVVLLAAACWVIYRYAAKAGYQGNRP